MTSQGQWEVLYNIRLTKIMVASHPDEDDILTHFFNCYKKHIINFSRIIIIVVNSHSDIVEFQTHIITNE